ncbi:hypothetical protein STAFG_3697 [Streptomyces afghaniensis 772]|uniref:Uncharacterized protein n=1 Tax=Streptomyces afghaniensis 772 TaxID=1283301 RepID=S4MZ48_9ACTN|nr:hypothetical protein STAFG_3697 [Streptomyces afghaniensis 772]
MRLLATGIATHQDTRTHRRTPKRRTGPRDTTQLCLQQRSPRRPPGDAGGFSRNLERFY